MVSKNEYLNPCLSSQPWIDSNARFRLLPDTGLSLQSDLNTYVYEEPVSVGLECKDFSEGSD